MKVFFHDKNWPKEDQVRWYNNWSGFDNDPRTENVDLHIGSLIDYSKFRKDKININYNGEWPNELFNGRKSGQNVHRIIEIENKFDYVLNFDKSTADARGHVFAPYGYNYENVLNSVDWENIDKVKKDIEVFMIGNSKLNKTWEGEPDAIHYFYDSIKNFKHVFCNNQNKNAPGKKWIDSMKLCARSKISVVWVDFFHTTAANRKYANDNYEWMEFKNAVIKKDISKLTVPQMKGRVYYGAFCKSLLLCYKGPWANQPAPRNSPILDYLQPEVDFIYFDDCDDLNRKIKQILDDYDNPKYKKMVNSAHDKMKNNFNLENLYENYIVPLAKKGKTK